MQTRLILLSGVRSYGHWAPSNTNIVQNSKLVGECIRLKECINSYQGLCQFVRGSEQRVLRAGLHQDSYWESGYQRVFGHLLLTKYRQLSGKIVGQSAFEVKQQKCKLVLGWVIVSCCCFFLYRTISAMSLTPRSEALPLHKLYACVSSNSLSDSFVIVPYKKKQSHQMVTHPSSTNLHLCCLISNTDQPTIFPLSYRYLVKRKLTHL